MKFFDQFKNWCYLNQKALKFYAVLILIIIGVAGYISRGIHIKKSTEYKVRSEMFEKKHKDNQHYISILNKSIEHRNKKITELENENKEILISREETAKERDEIKSERDDLKVQVESILESEIYDLLMLLLPFEGKKEYLFNGPQIEEIYLILNDYKLVLKDNIALEKDVDDCNKMVINGDSIQAQMAGNILDLNKKDSVNNTIIFDLQDEVDLGKKENKRLTRKLNVTRIVAGVIVVGTIIVSL
jgi:hypothetical protein